MGGAQALISLPQMRQTSKAGAWAVVASLRDSREIRLLSCWAWPGLGARLPTGSWGWAWAAITGTPTLSGGTREQKGLAGPGHPWMKLIPREAGGATRMGSHTPSLCCRHWGICHPREKRQTGLQLCPRG